MTFILRRIWRVWFAKPEKPARRSVSRLTLEQKREDESTKPTVPDAKPWRSSVVPKGPPPEDPHR